MVNVTASYSQKHFLLEALSIYFTFPFLTIGFFWRALESIHKLIIKLHALQFLFVRESNKQQMRGGITLNFTKEEAFFICYNNQMLFRLISRCSPPSGILWKKVFLSLSVWPRREYNWTLIWKKSLLIYFESH